MAQKAAMKPPTNVCLPDRHAQSTACFAMGLNIATSRPIHAQTPVILAQMTGSGAMGRKAATKQPTPAFIRKPRRPDAQAMGCFAMVRSFATNRPIPASTQARQRSFARTTVFGAMGPKSVTNPRTRAGIR
jgi:hypothetical protein